MKKQVFLLILGLLLINAVAFAQDHTTVDSGAIAIGETQTGEFEVGSRYQYTLEIADDTTPIINVFLDSSDDIDTYLRVYHSGEAEPFAQNDDRGDGTLFSALEGLEVSSGDVLVVEVATYAESEAGAYSVRVSTPPTVEDIGAITAGEAITGTLAENSRHRYTLSVAETTPFMIAVEGAGEFDTYLRIYNAGDEKATVQNNNLSDETVNAGFDALVIPGGSELIVEVGGYSDNSAGDYTLTVTPTEVDIAEAATPLAVETVVVDDICAAATEVQAPQRIQYFAPENVLEAGVNYGAVFCTEAGNFHITFYEEEAPITVNSFVYLALNHFFDGITFHRVIGDFVVQGGDPTGGGSGGPGYEFVNETDNDLTHGGIGVMSMANAGPDTNGSQFFITLAPVARLDGGYSVFGQVMRGMSSVFDIAHRDPATATEEGTKIYTVIIVTTP